MKSILAIIGSLALATYMLTQGKRVGSGLFESWKVEHGLVFTAEEEPFRRAIF
jgi:hypothetical protein